MGVFYTPPPAQTGGAQPYDGLARAHAPIPDASFLGKGIAQSLVAVLVAAQVVVPAPITPKKLPAALLNYTPDNPPFGLLETNIDPWLGPPQAVIVARNLPPDILSPASFQPARQAYDHVIAAWQPGPQLPQRGAVLNPSLLNYTPDNPPFGTLETITEPWVEAQWLQVRRQLVLSAVADNPPLTGPQSLYTVVASWQPVAPPIQRGVLLAQSVVIDNPPVAYSKSVSVIVAAWQPPPPQAPRGGLLNPALLNYTPDNPPFGTLETFTDPWLDQPTYQFARAKVPPASIDDPPGLPDGDIVIVSTVNQLPQRRPLFVPISFTPDNPPVAYSKYINVVVAAWQPGPPQAPRGGLLNPALLNFTPDRPPVVTSKTLPVILAAWQPGPPQAPRGGPLSPALFGFAPDNPPFGTLETNIEPWLGSPTLPQTLRFVPQVTATVDAAPGTVPASLYVVLGSWQPGPSQPQRGVLLNPSLLNVQFDNPPIHRMGDFNTAPWFVPYLLPHRPRHIVQPFRPIPVSTTGHLLTLMGVGT